MGVGVPPGGDEHLWIPSHLCSGCFARHAPAPALQRLRGSVTAPGRGAAQPGQVFAGPGQNLGSLQNFLLAGEANLCLGEASTQHCVTLRKIIIKEKSVF